MKKLGFILVFALVIYSCGEEGRQAEGEVNRAMKKVEEGAEVLADSAKEKYKDVRDHLDTALDRDRDDTVR